MYNLLKIIIFTSSVRKPKKTLLKIIPYPNIIKIKENYAVIHKDCTFFVENINPTNSLLTQFKNEMKAFQIHVDIIKKEFSIENIPEIIFNQDQEKEGYALTIHPTLIVLQAASLHGLFNGFQTFRQVLQNGFRDESGQGLLIPNLDVIDWPSLEIRGVADDISRGQIPNMSSIKRFIRDLSRYKNNYYTIYIQDVFRCSNHPKIGKGRGAYTPEELLEIDKYAKSRFVKFFPIFETLGHFDNILSIAEYRDLGEFPGAQCLSIANGHIYPFLRDFIEELSPCFSSKIFHIGLDETFDLGHGNSKKLIEAIGIEEALFDHIRKISEIVKDNGSNKIILYHDIVLKYPKLLEKLPKDIILMYWDYSPKKKYPKIEKIVDNGFPIIVSPSMLCWSRHFPDYKKASKNIINIIESAKNIKNKSFLNKNKVLGQLNSTWGDFSNHNLRENNIYGAILSATSSWTIKPFKIEDFFQDLGFVFYGLESKDDQISFRNLLLELSNLRKYYKKGYSKGVIKFFDYLYRNPFRDLKTKPEILKYKALYSQTTQILNMFNHINQRAVNNKHYLQYMEYSIKIIQLLASKEEMRIEVNLDLKKYASIKSNNSIISNIPKNVIKRCITTISLFRDKAYNLMCSYEKLWLKCAKRPNLDYPLTRFKNLITFCDKKIENLKNKIIYQNPMLPSYYIWSRDFIYSRQKPRYFIKKFNIKGNISTAKIQVIAGNYATIYINDEIVGEVFSRFSLSILPMINSIKVFDVKHFLKKGINIIGIEANHFLESRGFLNFYMEYIEETKDKKPERRTLISDKTWRYTKDSIEKMVWSNPEINNENKKIKWKKIKVLGKAPEVNGDIYRPNILKKGKSTHEDDFGLKSQLFFKVETILNKFVAKLLQFLKII